eukprot:42194-Pyramimonas_sp.AAC.1
MWQRVLGSPFGFTKEKEARRGGPRFRAAAVCLGGPDGHFSARPRAGALQGDPWAVEIFIRDVGGVFQQAQEQYAVSYTHLRAHETGAYL